MNISMRSTLLKLCVLVGLLAFASAPRAAGQPVTDCPGAGCRQFLPLLFYAPPPLLIAPSHGEQTISLAPKLSWTPTVTGTYQVEMSIDPSFNTAVAALEINDQVKVTNFQTQEYIPIANVNASTTFYWRVGAPSAGGYVYSEVRRFTTPVRISRLLPPPVQPLSPANNSLLPSTSVTLSWQAVPNVIGYRVRMADANDPNDRTFGPGSATLPGTQTSHLVTGLKSGVTYAWKVKALNQHGWGSYGPIFTLRAP